MWIEAVDVILQRMKQDKFPFERVVDQSGTLSNVVLHMTRQHARHSYLMEYGDSSWIRQRVRQRKSTTHENGLAMMMLERLWKVKHY
jgi:hypothetical protein